jgi:Chromate transporter
MALAELAPGPLAAQLAIYMEWVRFGIPGATAVAFAFIAPSFVMVLALAAAYVRFGAWRGCKVRSTASVRRSSPGRPGRGVVAAAGVFPPCYLLVVIPVRISGVSPGTLAVKPLSRASPPPTVGAIAGAAIVLGRRAVHDLPTCHDCRPCIPPADPGEGGFGTCVNIGGRCCRVCLRLFAPWVQPREFFSCIL